MYYMRVSEKESSKARRYGAQRESDRLLSKCRTETIAAEICQIGSIGLNEPSSE